MNKNSNRVGIFVTSTVVIAIAIFGIVKYKNDHKVCPVGDSACGSVSDTANTNSTSSNSGSSDSSTAPSESTTSTPAAQQPSKPSSPSCYSASDAANEIGQSGCVQFVGYAYTSDSGQMYLDQSTSAPYGFSVWIPAGYSFGSTVLNEYSGKTIDVSGTITQYDGEPEIEVTSASQIQAN